ncbi:MAG: hypothetical protein IPJ20_23500 [Flammeovirgaceae bacterium]|nr:hypothetical protein [Flammeovirgaceae bacterium]
MANPQTFNYENTKYKLEQTFEDYNSVGLPITTSDFRKNISSILYGFDQTPAVVLSNARVKETVFADFEHVSSSMAGAPSSFITTEAWSGKGSYQWMGGTFLSKMVVNKELEDTYRFSCWIKS